MWRRKIASQEHNPPCKVWAVIPRPSAPDKDHAIPWDRCPKLGAIAFQLVSSRCNFGQSGRDTDTSHDGVETKCSGLLCILHALISSRSSGGKTLKRPSPLALGPGICTMLRYGAAPIPLEW